MFSIIKMDCEMSQPLVNEQDLQKNQENPQLQEELNRFKEIQKNTQQLLQRLREMEQLKAQEPAMVRPVRTVTDILTETGNEKEDEMNIIVTPENKSMQEKTDAGSETRIFSQLDMNIVGTTKTKKKPFQCHICGNGFAFKCSMTQHIQVHNGRRFICDVGNCYSFFTTRQGLKKHKLIHAGEKPYLCKICNRLFRQKQTLSDHLKIHTGEKPFPCNLCGRSFRQKKNLSRHMHVHTRSNPYSCAICQKSFLHKNTLRSHLKTHVGQESTEISNVTGMIKMEENTPNI